MLKTDLQLNKYMIHLTLEKNLIFIKLDSKYPKRKSKVNKKIIFNLLPLNNKINLRDFICIIIILIMKFLNRTRYFKK